MAAFQSISASEFKAKCLEVLKQLDERKLDQVTITRHGKPVAILTPPAAIPEGAQSLHGFMRGSFTLPDEVDLTLPASEARFDAEDGILHR